MSEIRAVRRLFESQARDPAFNMSEMFKMMDEDKVESLLQLKQCINKVWKAAWSLALPGLQAVAKRPIAISAPRKRKHDLSRCGIRVLYERMRSLQRRA